MGEILFGNAGSFKSFLISRLEKFLMFAFGEMRNNTAKFTVKLDLRGNDVREGVKTVRNSNGSFIARSVDG